MLLARKASPGCGGFIRPLLATLLFTALLGGCDRSGGADPLAQVGNKAGELYSRDGLLAAIESIRSFHARHGTGMQLNAPASDADIERAEAFFDCKLPEELITLWRWHDGESTEKFIWYHKFLSVQESMSAYRLLVYTPLTEWRRSWVPVFAFEGEWYGVACAEQRTTASPVVFYFIESGPAAAYSNLTRYMQTMAEALANGALAWDGGDDWWREDIGGLAASHARLNPGIPFPYYVGDSQP